MNQEATSRRKEAPSEVFIGVCEMETDVWACGNCDTLVGTHVNVAKGVTEYRYVCTVCARMYGGDDDFARFGENE